MPLESVSAGPEFVQRRMQSSLAPIVEIFILAYVNLIGSTVVAQERPSLKSLEATVSKQIPLMDEDDPKKRVTATNDTRRAIHEAIKLRNPLPHSFLAHLNPQAPELTTEQRARLRVIMEQIHTLQQQEPGRLASPEEHNLAVHELLSRQFFMPVRACNDELAQKLATYREGYEGQPSAEALQCLCDKYRCIPVLTQTGIVLEPIPEGTRLRINEKLCVVERTTPDGTRTTVFHMPDSGVLLSSKYSAPYETQMAEGAYAKWKSDWENTSPPYGGLKTIDNQNIKVITGIVPETKELHVGLSEEIEMGAHTFQISAVEEQKDGTWKISMIGSIFEGLPWSQTTDTEDMYSYQLAAASRFCVTAEKGETEYCTMRDLVFDTRLMSFNLNSSSKPKTIAVRAYRNLTLQRMELP